MLPDRSADLLSTMLVITRIRDAPLTLGFCVALYLCPFGKWEDLHCGNVAPQTLSLNVIFCRLKMYSRRSLLVSITGALKP